MPIGLGASLSASVSLIKVTEWIPNLLNYLKPYRPEIKNVNINYRNRNTELGLSLHIPDGHKRQITDIEIPLFQNCIVESMMDSYFNQINLDELVRLHDQKIKIKCSKLPPSEDYFLRMKGQIPQETLDDIVHVQPARNKDRTIDSERYWLSAMIRNAESLEQLWEALNVDHVTAGVDIGVERYLSTNLPPDLDKGLQAMREWGQAAYSRNRDEVTRAWLNMHAIKNSKITVEELVQVFNQLTATEFFAEFIEIDNPYSLGKIQNKKPYQTLPENIYAEGCTRLSLKRPTAEGYMTFKKKDYVESVKQKYDEIL